MITMAWKMSSTMEPSELSLFLFQRWASILIQRDFCFTLTTVKYIDHLRFEDEATKESNKVIGRLETIEKVVMAFSRINDTSALWIIHSKVGIKNDLLSLRNWKKNKTFDKLIAIWWLRLVKVHHHHHKTSSIKKFNSSFYFFLEFRV